MPPPQASYLSRTSDKGYDPATLSDDEPDSDSGSVTSRSTWTSSAAAGAGDETAILGLVDGLIPEDRLAEELADWKISRVGGLPSFPLTHAPPPSSSHCLSCSQPMPLLLQLYCPLPSSTLERVLYVFSCPRPQCRRKEGAVRVWRANGVWREGKVEEERREREEREREERRERAKNLDLGGLVFASSSGVEANKSANPFNPFAPPSSASASSNPFVLPASSSTASATASTAPASNPFASTSNPFAAPAPPPSPAPAAPPPSPAPAASFSTTSPLAQTTSSWSSSSHLSSTLPSHPAQYLTTMYEPPSSTSTSKGKGKGKERELAKALEVGLRLDAEDHGMDSDDDDEEGGTRRAGKGSGGRVKKGAPVSAGDKRKTGSAAAGGSGGGGEWQKEGYEVQKVKGVDEVFLRFQERVAREGRQVVRYEYGAEPLPYTGSSSAYRMLYRSSSSDSLGHFSPAHLPPCLSCRSPTTFEAQLMPHLVSLCPDQDWATVWVVSCSQECGGGAGGERTEEGDNWREERALVEWEEEAV
ncbi:hypothetical protein NBRC10512_007744 [Rhodotorula toruloides]|uniref:RHTO0S01e16380g1_1 n=1 Tax=Rhodotorula toruloides TaxID=5286 RepID=A0A061ALH4_RHOTO|nr:RHTO0S01e16380g1_1 [Rhodotorula toruloides]